MLNFTVGPVMSPSEVLEVSAKSAPYFRTPEFSQVMLENERIMLDLLSAPKDSRCVFLTASGTGAMEAAVMSVLAPAERVAVVNGGSFGQRFVDLCQLHGHNVNEIKLEFGRQVTRKNLEDAVESGCGALLVNMHETSSGLLYDMRLLSEFCREREMLLIVDAVSAFIAEEIDMAALGADVVLTGSQKALACHPGISLMALSPRGQERVAENPEVCSYLSLKEALRNGDEDVREMREAYNQRRRYLMYTFREMGLPCFEPYGAFYVFPCIKEFGMTSDEFATRFLQEEKVAVVPGTAFGDCGEGFIRISYAYSLENLKVAIGRLADFVERLKKEQKK